MDLSNAKRLTMYINPGIFLRILLFIVLLTKSILQIHLYINDQTEKQITRDLLRSDINLRDKFGKVYDLLIAEDDGSKSALDHYIDELSKIGNIETLSNFPTSSLFVAKLKQSLTTAYSNVFKVNEYGDYPERNTVLDEAFVRLYTYDEYHGQHGISGYQIINQQLRGQQKLVYEALLAVYSMYDYLIGNQLKNPTIVYRAVCLSDITVEQWKETEQIFDGFLSTSSRKTVALEHFDKSKCDKKYVLLEISVSEDIIAADISSDSAYQDEFEVLIMSGYKFIPKTHRIEEESITVEVPRCIPTIFGYYEQEITINVIVIEGELAEPEGGVLPRDTIQKAMLLYDKVTEGIDSKKAIF